MLGGATGATQPLGRGEAGPSSLASSEQTLTEAGFCFFFFLAHSVPIMTLFFDSASMQ